MRAISMDGCAVCLLPDHSCARQLAPTDPEISHVAP